MTTFATRDVQDSARRAVREGARWIERLARIGFAAKGLVYLIIGVLALQAALGRGGQATDSEGAMRTILHQTYGWVLLVVVAIGLAGYATWRFAQAALDPEHVGRDAKGGAKRAGYAISGVIHAGLALAAARMALGSGRGGSGGSNPQDWTALLLAQPLGRWIAAAVGLGIVFALVGGFLVRAALASDSSQARGLGGALESLHGQAYGPWLLGLVAVGLIAFGLFEWVQARYRRIHAA